MAEAQGAQPGADQGASQSAHDFNLDRIGLFLHNFGNELPSGPQEMLVIESRKLEGSTPMTGFHEELMSNPDLAKRFEDLRLLRGLIDPEMKNTKPHWWVTLHPLYLADDPQPFLLDRLRTNRDALSKTRVGYVMDAVNWLAKRVAGIKGPGYRLSVAGPELALLKEMFSPEMRKESVQNTFTAELERNGGKVERAVQHTMRTTGYGRSQVYNLCKSVNPKAKKGPAKGRKGLKNG